MPAATKIAAGDKFHKLTAIEPAVVQHFLWASGVPKVCTYRSDGILVGRDDGRPREARIVQNAFLLVGKLDQVFCECDSGHSRFDSLANLWMKNWGRSHG